MNSLERLTWSDSLAFSSYGVRIAIRVNQSNLRGAIGALLPPGCTMLPPGPVERVYSLIVNGSHQQGDDEGFHLLYEDSKHLVKHRELTPILKFLAARLRRTVAELAPRRVFVHAGVVAHRGRAIVIPGPTMSGKSTLVSELLRHGAIYYSDEYAVLDADGMVYPFPKPVSLRAPVSFDSIDFEAEYFGASSGNAPLPIGLVVVTHYQVGARWRPRTLSHGQGALTLMAHAIAARRDPRRVMASLLRAVAGAIMLKGVRGEAFDLSKQMLEIMERENAEEQVGVELNLASRRR